MTFGHITNTSREEEHAADPEDATITELTGEAPPCDECGSAPAVERVDGRDLCGNCLE